MRNIIMADNPPLIESQFLRAETIFENDMILVAKAYYYHKETKPSGYYYDIDIGIKDETGDVDGFHTIVSKQTMQIN